MIRINNIHIPLDYSEDTVKKKVCRELKIRDSAIKSVCLFRRSIDARKKDNIYFLCSVDAELFSNEAQAVKKCKNAALVKPYNYEIPDWKGGASPLVVGTGPAGLFAALILAQSGANPIVIERGKDVDSRTADVNSFWQNGKLNTNSNVQFGEGGAGTFSDGKLNTGTKDSRQRKVLNEFVAHGAPEEILYNAKPHIGTDRLRTVVGNLRRRIETAGGEVRFSAKLADIGVSDGAVTSAVIRQGDSVTREPCAALILAIGHGARDTARMLYEKGIAMSPKAFAIGVRAEHPQSLINTSQYGPMADHPRLGAAEYRLTAKSGERGVYTFCMCPGGQVVASASGPAQVVVNGMSNFARDGKNANAAIVVQITPDDFGTHPLDGLAYLDRLERTVFLAGGGDGTAPASTVGAFLRDEASKPSCSVEPTYRPGVRYTRLSDCLPDFVAAGVRDGIKAFGRQLKGYDMEDAVLTAVESRTSSPLRILRDSAMESVSHKGLYPIGEGAGYAGGIVSAAVDGMKAAEAVMRIYAPLP